MTSKAEACTSKQGPYKPTIIIHGGAGNISRASLPPSLYERYHASLTNYLTSTNNLLKNGSDAVDAACHAVALLEDDPLFNCGRGSVFNVEGSIEMEASLMVASVNDFMTSDASPLDADAVLNSKRIHGLMARDELLIGRTKRSAAVSMIKRTRHPILLAKEVLRMPEDGSDSAANSDCTRETFPGKGDMHGHLSGSWVEEWGFKHKGLEKKSKEWFWTKKRWEEHRRGLELDVSHYAWLEKLTQTKSGMDFDERDYRDEIYDFIYDLDGVKEVPSQGTVGAVCMDSWGNVCTATSTGGLTNKRAGRVGDTPTVGAGFWAEDWCDTSNCVSPLKTTVNIGRILSPVIQGARFWFGDCLPGTSHQHAGMESKTPLTSIVEHESLLQTLPTCPKIGVKWLGGHQYSLASGHQVRQFRAVAMSGTGNGDSFLRINAVRTAAAISRFCSLDEKPIISLQKGITNIAGPGGELQRSAGERWGKTGEGEGGIIGIEVIRTVGQMQNTVDAKVAFDFNCGGMWRAYYKIGPNGNQIPTVMVFKEEYEPCIVNKVPG